MSLKEKRLLSLKEIDGPQTPHDAFLKRAIELRVEALGYVNNASKLADYLGGEIESLGLGEDWAIKKEIFPGIKIHFIYRGANEEFPGSLSVLYGGPKIRKNKGEDLVELTIACLNHMLRYVRETTENPSEICTRV